MTLFQALLIPMLGAFFCLDGIAWCRTGPRLNVRFGRCVIWLLGLSAVIHPPLLQNAAEFLGIGRGTDVVLYLHILISTLAMFCLYARYVALQTRLTETVRVLAISSARSGGIQRPSLEPTRRGDKKAAAFSQMTDPSPTADLMTTSHLRETN
jgi:small membrane protein